MECISVLLLFCERAFLERMVHGFGFLDETRFPCSTKMFIQLQWHPVPSPKSELDRREPAKQRTSFLVYRRKKADDLVDEHSDDSGPRSVGRYDPRGRSHFQGETVALKNCRSRAAFSAGPSQSRLYVKLKSCCKT